VRFWPEAARRLGHLRDAHIAVRHLDEVTRDGHLDTVHLEAEHLWPARRVVLESPSYVFGRFAHALRLFDGVGNVSGEPPASVEVLINSAPAVPRGLAFVGHDGATGQLTFTFCGVRFAPVRGL
jgi:hypothetical protein